MISVKSNKNSAKIWGTLLTVAVSLIFLFIAFQKVDLSRSFSIISETSFIAVLLYLVVFFASHYARAIRWKFMLDSVKPNISYNHLFGSVMVSYGVSCIIPRLGEVYRALFLGKWENISRTTVLGTIVVERIIDVTFFAFASLVSASIYSGNLYEEIPWLKTLLVTGFSLIFLAVIFLILLVRFQNRFTALLVSLTAKLNFKLSEKLKSLFETLVEGFSSIKTWNHFAGIIFWSFIIMMLYALNTYAGFFMLDMHNVESINFASAWIVMTISSFGNFVPTPGGTGSYHAIAIFVLTKVYGFDSESGAAYAILTHFVGYVAFIVSTFIIISYLNMKRAKQGLSKETFLSVLKLKTDQK
ncbi:MAG: lysylphosphatidylglycerol synthase transmembrane domain-containing protein [Bacteroidota bacterium]